MGIPPRAARPRQDERQADQEADPLKRRDLFLIEGTRRASGALSWGSMAGWSGRRCNWPEPRAEGEALVPKLLYPVAEEVYRDFFSSVKGGLVSSPTWASSTV